MTYAVGYSMTTMTFALMYDEQDVCVDAPPIARWCIGRTRLTLDRYWQRRGATVRPLDADPPTRQGRRK